MHRHMALVAEGRHPREPPVSRSDADTAWVANRPGYPTPVQPDGRRWGYGQRIPPTTVRPNLGESPTSRPVHNGTFRPGHFDTPLRHYRAISRSRRRASRSPARL